MRWSDDQSFDVHELSPYQFTVWSRMIQDPNFLYEEQQAMCLILRKLHMLFLDANYLDDQVNELLREHGVDGEELTRKFRSALASKKASRQTSASSLLSMPILSVRKQEEE